MYTSQRADPVFYHSLWAFTAHLYIWGKFIQGTVRKTVYQHWVAQPFTPLAPQSLSFLFSLFLPGEDSYEGCTAEGHAVLIAPLNEVIHNVASPLWHTPYLTFLPLWLSGIHIIHYPAPHPNPWSAILANTRTHTDTHSHLTAPRANRDQGPSGWKGKFHWIKWEITQRATLKWQQIQTDGWSLINIWTNVWGQKGVKSGKRSGKARMEGEMLQVIKRWCKICITGTSEVGDFGTRSSGTSVFHSFKWISKPAEGWRSLEGARFRVSVPTLQLLYITECTRFQSLRWIFHTFINSWAVFQRNEAQISRALPPHLNPSTLSPSVVLCSTHGPFFLPPLCPFFTFLSLPAPPSFFPVWLLMGLKDVCDVTRIDGEPVSGTPLPPLKALLQTIPLRCRASLTVMEDSCWSSFRPGPWRPQHLLKPP